MSDSTFAYVATIDRDDPHGSDSAGGLNVYSLDRDSGQLALVEAVRGFGNPMSLVIDPSGRFLYAVSDSEAEAAGGTGVVTAFAIDSHTGSLERLNQQPTGGSRPIYVSTGRGGRAVFVANLASGSLSMLPVDKNGRLQGFTDVQQHVGSSVHPERQRSPHVHSVVADPSDTYVLAADLGIDRVVPYRVDWTKGRLDRVDAGEVSVRPGSGPRHLTFHPTRSYAYLVSEMGSEVSVFRWGRETGELAELQSVSALPADFAGTSTAADIQVSPDARFVHVSNRGHDTVVTFAVDPLTGKLDVVGHTSTGGKAPQSIAVSGDGQLLVVGNRDSNELVALRRDETTGLPRPVGRATSVPVPVSVKLLER